MTLLARGWVPVLAGLGYWILLGIPVLIVGVGRLLGHDATEITLAAAGQSLSGLLNVVLAELAAGLPGPIQRLRARARPEQPKRLRTQLFHQLVPLTAIRWPCSASAWGDVRAPPSAASADLADRVRLVGHRVGDIVAEHESALRAVAGRLATTAGSAVRRPRRARAGAGAAPAAFTSLLLSAGRSPAGRRRQASAAPLDHSSR